MITRSILTRDSLPDFSRPTAAQMRNRDTAELMLAEALSGLRAEDIPALLSGVLVARFGAAKAEWIGERTGGMCHLKGRV